MSDSANRAVRGLVIEDLETRRVGEIAEAMDERSIDDAGDGSGGSIALLVAVDDDAERLVTFGDSSGGVHDDDPFEHDGLEGALAADTFAFSRAAWDEIERKVMDDACGCGGLESSARVEEFQFTRSRRIASVEST